MNLSEFVYLLLDIGASSVILFALFALFDLAYEMYTGTPFHETDLWLTFQSQTLWYIRSFFA